MNLKIIKSQSEIQKILDSNIKIDFQIERDVSNIIKNVQENSDQYLLEICNKFDNANFNTSNELLVTKDELNKAYQNTDKKIIKAFEKASERIADYHKKQLPQDFEYQDEYGNLLGNKWKAINDIGVYVPSGSAPYPSSVLMSAIPAQIAGSKNISITTPSQNGQINSYILVAAQIININKIYKVGGAAAIAALTFGTKIVNKVNKIVGPGNAYVAIAKKQLFGQVGIDMIAGPTDITIISDGIDVNEDWIIADLLSQLEHGSDSKAFLITDNEDFANKVNFKINSVINNLSRKDIIQKSILNSAIILVSDLADSSMIANKIAPEHLQIICQNEAKIVDNIENAGAIFIGKYSPEAIGDYIAGPSHSLPTMGTAKFSSGLSIFDFMKRISIISCNKDGFNSIREIASLMAKIEGFDAHKLSIDVR